MFLDVNTVPSTSNIIRDRVKSSYNFFFHNQQQSILLMNNSFIITNNPYMSNALLWNGGTYTDLSKVSLNHKAWTQASQLSDSPLKHGGSSQFELVEIALC